MPGTPNSPDLNAIVGRNRVHISGEGRSKAPTFEGRCAVGRRVGPDVCLEGQAVADPGDPEIFGSYAGHRSSDDEGASASSAWRAYSRCLSAHRPSMAMLSPSEGTRAAQPSFSPRCARRAPLAAGSPWTM